MIRHWYFKNRFVVAPPKPSLILHPKLDSYPLSNYNNKSKHAAQFASLLSRNLQPQELHSIATTVNNSVHRDLLAAAAVAGSECAKLVEANSTMNAAPYRVELLSEFSKIKTMAGFAQFDDGSGEAFERAVALGIAAGFGDRCRAVVCAMGRRLEFKGDVKLLVHPWSRSRRAQATKDIDNFLGRVKFQLQHTVTSSFILVNAPGAAFADLIVFGGSSFVCVQCKFLALEHVNWSKSSRDWPKMGSHSNNNSRKFLDRVISKVYDDPSKVKKHFVMVVRAGIKYAHLWARWFQRFARPDRHLFLIRPSANSSNAEQQLRFEVDIHHGRAAPIKHLPSPINFLALMRSINKQHLQLARTLVENSEPETLRWLSNHLTHKVKQPLLSALAEVGGEIAKLVGTAAANGQRNQGVEILSEHSKIKSLAEFAQFGDDSDSFERAVALAIASGADGRGVVCAVQQLLEFHVAARQLSNRQQLNRKHTDRSIEDLLAQVRFQLEHAAPCTFVLVNGNHAAFADIVVLGRGNVVLVQVKTNVTGKPLCLARFMQEWRKMGSHSSNNSRKFLDGLISKVFDDPSKVKKHFVMVVRAGQWAHIWPRWFTHSLRRHRTNNDHHFFLVRPDKEEQFRVEKFTK